MPDPRVSLVIVSRNRRAQLERWLPRHLALPERPEVILVDNASTDGSAEAVAERFPDVRVIRLERNRGGAARNVGTSAASTPYVAFTDDDAWWEPGALRAAADLLDAHPRLALINPHILVGEDDRTDPVCEEMSRSPLPPVDGQPGYPLLSFIACAAVVRREAFLGTDGFPSRFGVGGEEEIVGWDLVSAGWTMSYVPEIVGHHCPPPSAPRPERRETGIRNGLWTTWLRQPAPAAAVHTVHQLRRCPADRVTARAVLRAVAGLPWVARERRVSAPHVERMRRMLERRRLDPEARPPVA